jgi:catechol 2,3-dioxygenase-like lactoylglutathione lyase family enzyme
MTFPRQLPLDHIVIATGDLMQTITDYRALGFTVMEGGQHPGRTSHNALVVFGDGAYLELIAWQGPAPQERWYRVLTGHGDGLVDFALLPHDTAAVLAAARDRGLSTLNGPIDGGRVRPDGAQLKWQSARHTTPDVPFLCGDVTPRALRVPEGALRTHPNGVTGVASVTVAVNDLDLTLTRYKALLGNATADAVSPVVTPGSGIRSATIPICAATIVLVTAASTTPGAGEPGPARLLRDRLSGRGEGPCAVTLRCPKSGSGGMLNSALTHGVSFELIG